MKFNDAISGAVLLAIALAILVNIQSFPKIPGQNIGPAAFPGLLAGMLAVCALLLIVKGLRARRRAHDPGAAAPLIDSPVAWITAGGWLKAPTQVRNFLVTIACLLFYIFTSDWLGFIPCSILILIAMFLALGARRALILPVAVVATLVIHTAFYKGLRVPLPWGLLMPVAW